MTATLSPRRRRLRRTAGWLGLAAVLGLAIGGIHYWRSRPVAYRPDERPDDITSALSRSLPTNAPRPRFSEVAAPTGLGGFRNFEGARTSQLPEDMGPGLAWGDYDNDGDDDLFLVSAGGALNLPADQLLPCRLYENRGDGTLVEARGFPELRIHGLGAAWGDYDGDGFLDLAVSGYDALRLFRNVGGTGHFVPDSRLPDLKGFWTGLAWGDLDQDRRLDLYVCNYVVYVPDDTARDLVSDQLGTSVPFTLNPASYPGGRNALFRQMPDGSFTNVAAALGVENPEGRSLGVLWQDFDQDGWLELYVANDVSDNVLYRREPGRFRDISHRARVADYRSAMGLAAGDFDRDGDDDLFVTHWVAQENGFYENLWADFNRPRTNAAGSRTGIVAASTPAPRPDRPEDDGMARDSAGAAGPNPVAARFPLQFIDIADRQGLGQISLQRVGWGAEFVDLDQDGWLDLVVVNGSTLEIEGPPPRALQPQEPFVFWNRAGLGFHNLAPLNHVLTQKAASRGLACADYDGDGDMDFAVSDLGGGVRLLRNEMATGHWLKVRLRNRNAAGVANGFGFGTTAVAWVGGVPLRRTVNSVSYLSQSSSTLHWGLGAATRVDRLEIHWLGGVTQVVAGLEADAMYEVREGEAEPRRGDRRAPRPPTEPTSSLVPGATPEAGSDHDHRARTRQFWSLQRAGMQALKSDRDPARAIDFLRQALALDPGHQDSRYYLAQALARLGDWESALGELAELQRIAPGSHRAWQQWGVLRAQSATDPSHLAAAEKALQQAYQLNPEETGALLSLGALAVLGGNPDLAEERLEAVTRTNPRATGALFLRAYLAWQKGNSPAAHQLLEQASQSRGPDWKPKGATSEGDVDRQHHVEAIPLASFWEGWDGRAEPAVVFAALDRRLARFSRPAPTGSTIRP